MITKEQEKWIKHLSNDYPIKIIPFDPSTEEKFQQIKKLVQAKLGKDIKVEHHGATSLGISGQDEIDIYVLVSAKDFNGFIAPMSELFEKSKSHYDMERARFRTMVDGKKLDVFLTNEEHKNWINCVKFENYLKAHPDKLKEYEKMKERMAGSTPQDYYRTKTKFINNILELASKSFQ